MSAVNLDILDVIAKIAISASETTSSSALVDYRRS
jgi:hypothetical protein